MTQKKATLGRGLADLLGQAAQRAHAVSAPSGEPRVGEELAKLPLDLLQRGRFQPRTDMRPESLQELADSIKAQGIVQPIVVRPLAGTGDGAAQRYEIIAGERRWRAAQLAGLAEIPAVVRHVPDEAAIAMALIENIQRENLNPLEEARALLGLSQRRQQVEVAALVARKGLSVRETEALVRRLVTPHHSPGTPAQDPNVTNLESELSAKRGAKVAIQHGAGGKGKLVVSYNSLDELDGILAHIS